MNLRKNSHFTNLDTSYYNEVLKLEWWEFLFVVNVSLLIGILQKTIILTAYDLPLEKKLLPWKRLEYSNIHQCLREI